MSITLEKFQTTKGTTVKKVEAKDGRVMRFADGKPIKSDSYGAYKSHTPATEKLIRGNLKDIDSIEQLGNEYEYKTTVDTSNYPKGSDGRVEAANRNRWIGFKTSDNTPDDPLEAAKEYEKMKQELKDIDDPERQQEIKEKYNIGGSP